MIRTLIVDDEPKGREILKNLINVYCPSLNVVGTASNVSEAVDLINRLEPSLVFLDIQMPGENGFALLNYFPGPKFEYIFTTAYDEFAIKAIKVSALDYLLKPINVDELQLAVQKFLKKGHDQYLLQLKMLKKHAQGKDFSRIALPTMDGFEIIELENIVRIESDRNYSLFHLSAGKNILVTRSLKEYEILLEGKGFFRVHHSHLINMQHVKKYQKGRGGTVVMSDNSNIDVAVRRKDEFISALSGV